MLIADAEPFWKPPNVFDVATAVGLVLGLVSIWLSWWLAKRDIEKRIAAAADRASQAAREEVRRVAQAILQTGIKEAILTLTVAREACRGKAWPRAGELCELARVQLAGALAHPAATGEAQAVLESVTTVVLESIAQLRRKREAGSGQLPEEVLRGLDESILALRRTEGRMTGIRLEPDHG